jgi:flagellar secretion chaperone FliS
MSAAALRNRYLGDAVSTASPQRLLVMLYDRLALDLERAEATLGAGDREQSSELLLHAQEIVLELHSSLRVDSWEGAPRLSALYTWLHSELVRANVRQNARVVADCRKVVEPLRDAWREAAASLGSSPA